MDISDNNTEEFLKENEKILLAKNDHYYFQSFHNHIYTNLSFFLLKDFFLTNECI